MKNILVLGAGLVGSAIIKDLAAEEGFHVTAVDKDLQKLEDLGNHASVTTITADARNLEIMANLMAGADIILNALPGHLGYGLVKEAIGFGKDIVDIAFSPEDPMLLDSEAKRHGCRVITDMGVAPGMSNVLAGHAASLMQDIQEMKIVVGGLPQERSWPFEYKAVFSPIDVLEEYTRPARFIVNGQVVERPALSDQELINLPPVGTLEAFNSDGLRSLLHSIPARNMIEKTLRYPGHARLMEVFRHCGFFNTVPVSVSGQEVIPMDLTSTLLFDQWRLEKGETDLTIMRVYAWGYTEEEGITYQADLFDTFDKASGIHSMARTTGYAATAALRLLLSEEVSMYGVILPEILGKNDLYRNFLIREQAKRGIQYDISIGRL